LEDAMKRATVTKPGGLKRARQKGARVKSKESTKDSQVARVIENPKVLATLTKTDAKSVMMKLLQAEGAAFANYFAMSDGTREQIGEELRQNGNKLTCDLPRLVENPQGLASLNDLETVQAFSGLFEVAKATRLVWIERWDEASWDRLHDIVAAQPELMAARRIHLPKALYAGLRAGTFTGNTPRISFWWLNNKGDLIWSEEDQVPEREECLQILQLNEHMPPTEIILTRPEIAELREALGDL
jgi:hypothetical protein